MAPSASSSIVAARAVRFFWNRCHDLAWGESLIIADAGVEPGVEEVHEQIQHEEHAGVEDHETDHQRVIAVQGAVHDKDADAWDLKDVFDDERAGEQIG